MLDEQAGEGGGKSSSRRSRHVSARDKTAAVLRLIKGEDAATLADEIGVSAGRLEKWKATYLAAGSEALEKNTHQKTPYQKLTAKAKTIWPWVALLFALLVTVLLLVRFLNHDPVE